VIAATFWAHARKLSGKRMHRIVRGIGHNLPQEGPPVFAEADLEVDGYCEERDHEHELDICDPRLDLAN
jgi:hypothetical protein